MTNKDVTIQGALFSISQPYAAGHVLSDIEASVLNQTRTENVRNNTATNVKKLLEDAMTKEAAELVAAYDAEYSFKTARDGAGKAKRDPLEAEATKIAREIVRAQLKKASKKVGEGEGDVTKEVFDAAVETVSAKEEVIKVAKQRLAAQSRLLDATELSL